MKGNEGHELRTMHMSLDDEFRALLEHTPLDREGYDKAVAAERARIEREQRRRRTLLRVGMLASAAVLITAIFVASRGLLHPAATLMIVAVTAFCIFLDRSKQFRINPLIAAWMSVGHEELTAEQARIIESHMADCPRLAPVVEQWLAASKGRLSTVELALVEHYATRFANYQQSRELAADGGYGGRLLKAAALLKEHGA